MKEIDYICPMAADWNDISKLLERAYLRTHIVDRKIKGRELWDHIGLPVPLILAGWNFSSDLQKALAWRETVEWAERNGILYVIEEADFRKYGQNHIDIDAI